MQEQKLYTEADFRALQDTPVEPFKADLRMMCRAAFGPDWTDKHPGQAAIDRLRGYGFLPEAFIGMYEVIGGEERLLQAGLLPVEQTELDRQPKKELTAEYLVFCRRRNEEFSFSRFYWPAGHGYLDRPFCGVHQFSYDNPLYKKWKLWNKWCSWGGPSQFQTLSTALLRLVGELLAQALPNCVHLRVPLKKGEDTLARYESLGRRLELRTLETVFPVGWEYLCDIERGLVVRYFEESAKKVLVYSRDPLQLEDLEARWRVEWQKREGKKVLDPAKFIHSPAPATFAEKLEAMSRALLGKRSMALPPEEIRKAEARLGVQFPEALRQFYLRFGKGGKLFTSESLNDILTFQQMDPEDDAFGEDFEEALEQGSLLLAIENQGVWTMYLDLKTGEPWLDWGEGRQDCWGLDLEGALLYLLAMNATGFLPWGGECDMEYTPENRELLGHYFHFFLEGPMAVFADPDKGLVGCRWGEEQVCIMARSQKALDDLERDANIMVSMF